MARPKRPNRVIIVILAGIVAATALILASLTDHSKDKKDDRPMAPQHTATASYGSLYAQRVCNAMLDKAVVEYRTQRDPLSTQLTSGNSTGISQGDMFCTYSTPKRWAVGQASYQELTPKGVQNYNAARTGHDDALISRPIPASEMPRGVTSAFYFRPADMPADMRSWYHNPGAQMLVGTKLVVISVEDFDVLPSGVRQAFMKNALKDVIK